jgi:hypothetical protein
MSNNKPGQRKSSSGDHVQNEDIEDELSASSEDEDQDEMSAGAAGGAEDEEEQNGRAQQAASRRPGSHSGSQGRTREGFDARGGRHTRER